MDAKSSRLGLYCVADDILAPKIAISWPVPELIDEKSLTTPCFYRLSCLGQAQIAENRPVQTV